MRDLLPPGYVIDTSALIDLWKLHPRDIFPTLWGNVERLIHEENLIAPRQVLEELKRQQDALLVWAREQRIFTDLDAEQVLFVTEIESRFPSLVDHQKQTPDADPFVIALSKGWIVVSSESFRPTKPRIPDACAYYKLECLSLFDFFRKCGWQF